ncbi:MAG: adenylate/guanylate cyclase domain-containing protein [Actinomycetota bacterium]
MPGRSRRSGARLRIALFVAVALGATGIGLVGYGTNAFQDLELRSVDLRFSVRGTKPAPRDIVVVKVDDKTFNVTQKRWEQFRPLHARLIRRLKADGAKVIAYDVQFTEPSLNPADDNKLIAAVAAAGNVILATEGVGKHGETSVFGGDQVVRSIRARVANANFPADPGGYDRRMHYEISNLKTFAVVAVERATSKPVHPFNTTWIDYRGPVETFKTISFSDALQGQTPPGFFRGKIVVVGPWASTFQDLHPVSSGNALMPGPEIQANAISTVLRGLPLNSVPGWLDVALIIGLGLLSPLAGLRFSLRGTLAISVVAAAAYVVATQLTFTRGWIVAFVYPFGALTISSVGSLGAHYLLAAFERERVRDVFSRFVPESVVEQVLARTDDDLRLGGVSLVGTVMFTDLRGFTTFSESLPADKVIEALNIYLSEMTEAILDNEGTLVSYEGDGIMAVFGAPIEQDDHADQAVAASREMLQVRLPRWNTWLREHELSNGFKMGIGLNTGSFMSGNVGSERRLEYTAIGDTTNTASRLQGLTKGQPYLLFMADSTREAMTREIDDMVFVEEFEVRGRQESVKIWSIEAANSAAFDAREAEAAVAEGAAAD